ncbi:hypothetical protein [Dermatophilus congolensis]|uniref:hypothetical protein n=1 Tax=Dermatophilus congolensis TaxID=1863 RepID=UPI001AAFFBFA|nr:hypothetical protein [Dermatophilus congolensis]MBO3143003.1 hypothetical protein [Dermatophilus congolensis]MBO3151991.1 hypothetical protein [Dermatophilus congolensis]MBO3161000.1 hypothetical protein [Dermatophilus congolensis]MBO3163276.1 hypothetical protein [Dermatophilus congolensis]MBO3176833.1 hypothetical protein [Dermatophilus congolensis]
MKQSYKIFLSCMTIMVLLGIALILAVALPFSQGGSAPAGLLVILGVLLVGVAILARAARPDLPSSPQS